MDGNDVWGCELMGWETMSNEVLMWEIRGYSKKRWLRGRRVWNGGWRARGMSQGAQCGKSEEEADCDQKAEFYDEGSVKVTAVSIPGPEWKFWFNRQYQELGCWKTLGTEMLNHLERTVWLNIEFQNVGMVLNEEPAGIAFLVSKSTFSLWMIPAWLRIHRNLIEIWDIVLKSEIRGSAPEWPESSGEELIDCSLDKESNTIKMIRMSSFLLWTENLWVWLFVRHGKWSWTMGGRIKVKRNK